MFKDPFAGAMVRVLIGTLWLSSAVAAEPLRVLVETQGEGEPPSSAEVLVVSAESPEPSLALVLLNEGRGETVVDVDRSQTWRLRARADGFWSAQEKVAPTSLDVVRVRLWQAARLEAVVRTEEGVGAPEALRVTVSVLDPDDIGIVKGRAQPGEAEESCPIRDQGAITCELPSGRWNLRLDAPGFVPVYRWSESLESERPTRLGGLLLRRGSSILGRIVSAEGPAIDFEGIEVDLRRLEGGLEDEAASHRLSAKTGINEWGYFHFDAVAPGLYEIEAADEHLGLATFGPLEVRREEAVELPEPLVLVPPLRLVATVLPPLDPWREGWRIEVLREKGATSMAMVAKGRTQDGVWVSPPVSSGPYSLRITDGLGRSAYAWRDVEVTTDLQEVAVELDVVSVEGEVLLGGERLSSTVLFGGFGEESVEIDASAGLVQGALPRAGTWEIAVFGDDGTVQVRNLEVEVSPRRGTREADVTIEVPDTELEGVVAHEDGRPAADASVMLVGASGFASATSGDGGRFQVRGPKPGAYSVEARHGQLASEVVQFRLVDGSPTLGVRLTLRERPRLQGQVVTPAGPAARAQVSAFSFDSRGAPAAVSIPSATTAVDGSFELPLPSNAAFTRLTVLSPGYGFEVLKVHAHQENPIVIELRQGGGTLILPMPSDPTEVLDVVFVKGEPIHVPQLVEWALLSRSPVEDELVKVPAIPEGQIALCRMNVSEGLLVLGGAAIPAKAACRSGYLSEGGKLDLSGSG